MQTGNIYKISNDLNDLIYIGQTVRDIQIRFHEHCFDTRATSKIHKAIKELGYQHFKCELVEQCDSDLLDEREAYWVNYYNSYNNGYNSTFNGQYSNSYDKPEYTHIVIKGPDLVFESKTDCARQLVPFTEWKEKFIVDQLTQSIEKQKLFLDKYEVYCTDSTDYSSADDIEDWAKFLAVKYNGKHIKLMELDKDFDSITSAAAWILTNNYFTGYSKTPLQSLITSISGAIKNGNEVVLANNFHFEELPGTTKQNDSVFCERPIYCDQLQVEFPNSRVAAKYFTDHKLWGNIKLKTAVCRISDILRGYYREYKGYTFKLKNEDGTYTIPELLQIQLPFMKTTVPIDWVASEVERE